MDTAIPAAAQVRARLISLGHAEVKELSRISGVPFTTLWKIRDGETADPRLETVRQFYELIDQARTPRHNPATPEAAHG